MKSFLFVLSFLALAARRSAYAFAPKAPASAGAKQLVSEQSSTALEAYAMGGYGYANGNGLMYRSGGYGRYNDNYGRSRYGYGGGGGYGSSGYGGYGGYGGGGGYSLMPDSAVRGYGGMYDRAYYDSPYSRHGSGYNGYYNGYYNNNNRFDNNRRYFNSWSDSRYDSPYRYNRSDC